MTLLLAIALALASATAYAAAAVLQERLAAEVNPATTGGHSALLRILGRARWWVSVALNGAGGALHVGALALGPLSVVQPLGALTLVLALPIGAAAVGRRVRRAQWRGAGATIIGLTVLLALTAPGTHGDGLGSGQGLGLTVGSGMLIIALMVIFGVIRHAMTRSLLAATAAGVAFAVASALTQAVTRQSADTGIAAIASPLTLALAGMAVTGLLLGQLAYRDSGLGAPLATLTLANPIASAVIGVTLLGERSAAGPWGALGAFAAAVLASGGVVLLARPGPTDSRPASDRLTAGALPARNR